jgi:hypothetical protein
LRDQAASANVARRSHFKTGAARFIAFEDRLPSVLTESPPP